MSAYLIVLFLHIVGSLGMFGAFALEWASLESLRRATTLGQVREWLGLGASIRQVGLPSLLTLLVTGSIMTASRWGWQAWIGVALLSMVPIAVLGGAVSGRRVRDIARTLPAGDGPVPPPIVERLRDRALVVSGWLRTMLGLGIVYMMAAKPSTIGAFATLGVAIVLGLLMGFAPWYRERRLELVEPRRQDA